MKTRTTPTITSFVVGTLALTSLIASCTVPSIESFKQDVKIHPAYIEAVNIKQLALDNRPHKRPEMQFDFVNVQIKYESYKVFALAEAYGDAHVSGFGIFGKWHLSGMDKKPPAAQKAEGTH